MNYIIFDMEWNQPSSPKEKKHALAHGEIIQIGFFVLSDSLEILHKEEILIKPVCYPVINKYVAILTGITQEIIETGASFDKAIHRMAEFFSDDTILFTWGDDDMPILRENMKYHNITDITLPMHYNLQRFFCAQTDTPSRQIGLKTAAEHYNIEADVQAHDALNDAYLTLLVAKRLDIPAGIADYAKYSLPRNEKNAQQPWLNSKALFLIEQEFGGSFDGMASFCRNIPLRCSECGNSLKLNSLCRHGKAAFVTTAFCEKHGGYFIRYEHKNNTVVTSVYTLNEAFERLYRSRLRKKEKREKYKQIYKAQAKCKKEKQT
ncbi:MAG: exonuclease domain-containing protein [Ruminiclostridium sp.]|nr:exonuclease domain-containing protein [Ruminiclostridium sp.]